MPTVERWCYEKLCLTNYDNIQVLPTDGSPRVITLYISGFTILDLLILFDSINNYNNFNIKILILIKTKRNKKTWFKV